jgi:hypothetical protein
MLIKVKIFPCEKKREVIEKSADSFNVKVKAKPERGLANKELFEALSEHFNISKSKIQIIKGFKERSKIIKIIE